LHLVTPADVLAKYAAPITDAIRRTCATVNSRICARRGAAVAGPFRWQRCRRTDLQTDQTMRHLMGDLPGGLPEKQATTESISAMSPIRWFFINPDGV
jgi:hypothetical protein